MPTEKKQTPEVLNNERKDRGLSALGKKAATATGGIILIGKVAEAAERKVAEVSENIALEKQRNEILQAGEQIVGKGAVIEAEKSKAEIQNETENAAKKAYNEMLKERAKQEEKKAKQKKVTVKGPKKPSLVKEAVKSAIDPKDILLSVPGANLVWGAKKAFDVFKKFV